MNLRSGALQRARFRPQPSADRPRRGARAAAHATGAVQGAGPLASDDHARWALPVHPAPLAKHLFAEPPEKAVLYRSGITHWPQQSQLASSVSEGPVEMPGPIKRERGIGAGERGIGVA